MSVSYSVVISHVSKTLERVLRDHNNGPFVTLTFAQSLDGSITAQPGTFLQISGSQSQTMTHQLRAMHDTILIGINTLLTDDPRLNVRLVEGNDPRPIVVDSHLRFPLQAKLLQRQDISPIIATTQGASEEKATQLRKAGAEILRLPCQNNGWVSLPALLDRLGEMNIQTVMVEGGGQIITSFLAAKLVDQLVLTISPMFVAGVRAVKSLENLETEHLPRLKNLHYELLLEDIVIRGDLER